MKTNEEAIKEQIFREQSCFKCAHFPTCYYYRTILVLLVPRDEEAERFSPFSAEELAKICKFYTPDLP